MSKQTNQTNKKKKRKFMAIFFPIFGAAVVTTGVTLGCVYGCHKSPEWQKYFDDPGEEVRHQKASGVGQTVQYEFNLKEAVPTGEKVYGDVEVVKYSHNGVHATVTDFELNEGQKKATFTAAIDTVPQTNANGTTTYWADIKAEVKCKKTIGDEVVWETTIEDMRVEVEVGDTPEPTENYLKIVSDKESTLEIYVDNSGDDYLKHTPNLQYSYDAETWITCQYTEIAEEDESCDITIDAAHDFTIYLRGNNPEGLSAKDDSSGDSTETSITTINENPTDEKWTVSGSIMSLIDNKGSSKTIPGEYCFYHLFYENKAISTVSDDLLPTTSNIPKGSYYQMFEECTNLIAPAKLNATSSTIIGERACYGMFWYCSSLQMPENYILEPTTLNHECYCRMFSDCVSLTTTCQLPATTMASGCYNRMFYNCPGLTTIKPFKILSIPEYQSNSCNSMFFLARTYPESSYGLAICTTDQPDIDLTECVDEASLSFSDMFFNRKGVTALEVGSKYTFQLIS